MFRLHVSASGNCSLADANIFGRILGGLVFRRMLPRGSILPMRLNIKDVSGLSSLSAALSCSFPSLPSSKLVCASNESHTVRKFKVSSLKVHPQNEGNRVVAISLFPKLRDGGHAREPCGSVPISTVKDFALVKPNRLIGVKSLQPHTFNELFKLLFSREFARFRFHCV